MKFRSWLLVFVICFEVGCLKFEVSAATWLDPSLKWQTLETPHFSIHYYPELAGTARRLAEVAEEVNETITGVFRSKLEMKTQVVLLDITDYGNGFTTVFPYPCITLYLTDLSGNLAPYKYDNYLRYLFLHEYVHAVHLDLAEGGFTLLRAIFGRNIFPNALEPWFMTEGLATYMETQYTNAGRGRDPRWEMMMRMDVLEDNVKSIDQAAVETVLWPQGTLRYLYGVNFLEYLARQYREERLTALAHIYGDYLYSAGIDGAFVALYQKSLGQLWSDWLADSRLRYGAVKKSLGQLTVPRLLTATGYNNLKPKWSKDGRYIYHFQRNADDYPQLRRIAAAGGGSTKVLEGMFYDDNYSFSPDGLALYLSKGDTYRNFYIFKDLYRYELSSGRLTKLTNGLRASDPGVSPDGSKVVFAKNDKGTKRLMFMGLERELEPRGLLAGSNEGSSNYFSPVFSPDGQTIVAAKLTGRGEQRIVLIDPRTGDERILTGRQGSPEAPVSEANPTFSPGGDYAYFESDRTGIVNLYAYHLPTGRMYQVTNVLGGALMPDVSPDGKKLAYVSYSSRGYDIALLDIEPSKWKSVPVAVDAWPRLEKNDNLTGDTNQYPTHDYNPWPTLRPLFWIPDSYYNENGAQTSVYIGSFDPLQQHYYYATLGYDFTIGRPAYTLYYVNNQFQPQITAVLTDYSTAYSLGGTTYWERDQEGVLACSFISNRVFSEYDKQILTVGLENLNLTNISSLDAFVPRPNTGNLTALYAYWRYLNTRVYAKSISPEDGIDVALKVERFLPELQSDYKFTNYSGALSSYSKTLFPHHVLASRLSGYYSQGDRLEQGNLTWRYLSVRGYPYGLDKGNKGASMSLEYRFPLGYTERGFLYGFTFIDRLWGALFFDLGGNSFQPLAQLKFKRGIGGELHLEANTMFGGVPLLFKLGYAKGLDDGGQETTYFTFSL
ncbi:MAG: hypothetical protein WC632_02765 [Candidatus Margulisiibacteriota bacterium]